MSDTFTIGFEKREALGTGAARRLRRGGRIPVVLYGHGSEAAPLSIDEAQSRDLVGHPGLVSVQVTGQEEQISAIVKEVQRHPLTRKVIHIDLQSVKADQVLVTVVTIEAHGEPVGTHFGGVLEQSVREIEVRCLPADMIDLLTVDVSGMKLDDVIHVADIQFPEGLKPIGDPELAVFQVRVPRVIEEQEDEVEEEDEEAAEGEEGLEAEDGEKTADSSE